MNYAVSSRKTPHILHLITCPLILFITLIMIWWLLWGENINDKAKKPAGQGKRSCALWEQRAVNAQPRTSSLWLLSLLFLIK